MWIWVGGGESGIVLEGWPGTWLWNSARGLMVVGGGWKEEDVAPSSFSSVPCPNGIAVRRQGDASGGLWNIVCSLGVVGFFAWEGEV